MVYKNEQGSIEMKEIKRYLYYSPEVDENYLDDSPFQVFEHKEKYIYWLILDNVGFKIKNCKYYYIGEY
jgi:hypothetical protein